MSHRLYSPHNPKPQPGHFNNSTTRRPRSEKPLQTSGSRTFLSFSCFSIANQEAVSPSAALLVRLKALAFQKRPFFCSFRASVKKRRHLGCPNIMRSRGCAVQNKGITLTHISASFILLDLVHFIALECVLFVTRSILFRPKLKAENVANSQDSVIIDFLEN